jgi:hypothetical protein
MRTESQKTADHLTADWDRITGKISDETAFIQASGQFDQVRDAAVRAWEEGEAGVDGYRLAQLEAQGALVEYIREVGNIPPEKATEIIALIDQGKIDEAEDAFNRLARPRTAFVNVVSTGYANIPNTVASAAPWPGGRDGNVATPYPLAAGGIVKARPGGMLARIGEAGHDEAVIPLSGPNAPAALGGGSPTYNFTINNATDPDAVVRAIRQHVRRNGPLQGIT